MTGTATNARPVPLDEAHSVVRHWLRDPNIVFLDTAVKAVGGRETGQPAIVVGVIEKKPPAALTESDFPVPPAVELDVIEPDGSIRRLSLPTDVIETGEMVQRSLVVRRRPCPGGFRILAEFHPPWAVNRAGILSPGFGTLGVTTFYRNKRCLLANAHVIGTVFSTRPGSFVYQPDTDYDSDPEWDILGVCDGTFEIIRHYGAGVPTPLFYNRYDFAWCEVPDASETTQDLASNTVHGIYQQQKELEIRREPVQGETVKWVGQKTGQVQESTIVTVHGYGVANNHWPVPPGHSSWRDLLRINCESTTPGVAARFVGGDSGAALIASSDNRVVGLMSYGFERAGTDFLATRIPEDDPPTGVSRQGMKLRSPLEVGPHAGPAPTRR